LDPSAAGADASPPAVASGRPLRVLIAHQSTIPHYRVRFYELLEQRRPHWWTFEVVYDTTETDNPRFFAVKVDHRKFAFPVFPVRTRIFTLGGRRLVWQSFFSAARKYDALITDTYVANLTYVAAYLWQFTGQRRALWGIPYDMNERPRGLKRVAEWFKNRLVQRADHFFAYTEGSKGDLVAGGYPAAKITVLHNTIDVSANRERYQRMREQRDHLRERLGVAGKTALLYIGRLVPLKRIEFLVESFALLYKGNPKFHLFVIGGGPKAELIEQAKRELGSDAITYFGPEDDEEKVAEVFTASDLYVLPGQIGLAPLQAFCYDLPTLVFDIETHSPEREYLSSMNSVTLPGDTTPAQFAQRLPAIVGDLQQSGVRETCFASIERFTLEAMADNYIAGVESLLAGKRADGA